MEIRKEHQDGKLVVALAGRLDAMSAPELDMALQEELEGVKELVFDFADLVYIASAGLRTLLAAQKRMNKQGSMTMRHVQDAVMEVLSMTGFDDLLSIEK